MTVTEQIKAYALDIGYHKVGITSADSFDDHIEEVRSRGAMYDFYARDPRRLLRGARPRDIMPQARSIISLVWDYARTAFPGELTGKIGRIYQARCYGPPAHNINGARHRLMVDFLKRTGCRVGRGILVPERRAAARAGIVTFGKNNFAYAKGCGSFVVLSAIVVDKELVPDPPTLKVKCPDDCRACMDACPTGAIYEPLKLNPRRCIGFNNWWTQEGRPPDITGFIPYDIRDDIGTRVHGCDACQEACPRNRVRLKTVLPEDPFLEKAAEAFSLEEMLAMTDEFYANWVMPLMYNYIKEKKYFKRNAAIAMGNLGDPRYIPPLVRSLDDPQALVRGYAAWALGKIGGPDARKALESARDREDDTGARNEIAFALSMNR